MKSFQPPIHQMTNKPDPHHYFRDIEGALRSLTLSMSDKQIIYFSIGAHNRPHEKRAGGYAQALPWFVEKILTDDKLNKHLKIISCDFSWKHDSFSKSDLARHIEENSLQKYENNFYYLAAFLRENHFQVMIKYFLSVLKNGGVIFIAEYEGPQTIKLYMQLLQACKLENLDVANRLYFLNWEYLYTNTMSDKGSMVIVDVIGGNTFNAVDYMLLKLRCNYLCYLVSFLSGQHTELAHHRLENGKRSKQEFDKEISGVNEEICRIKSIIHDQQTLFASCKDYLKINDLIKFPLSDLSDAEYLLIDEHLVDAKKTLEYRLASLIPTKYFPLLDFQVAQTDQVFTAHQVIHEQYANDNILNMFNEKSILEISGLDTTAIANNVQSMSSASTLFSSTADVKGQVPHHNTKNIQSI